MKVKFIYNKQFSLLKILIEQFLKLQNNSIIHIKKQKIIILIEKNKDMKEW